MLRPERETAARRGGQCSAVDSIEPERVRVDALRQLQPTLMLLHQFMLHDLLTNEDREPVLTEFLELSVVEPTPDGGARPALHGYPKNS